MKENKTGQYEMTIIVPVYNEEDNLSRVEQMMVDFLPKAVAKCCVLFVNDGSTDGSLEMIKQMCGRHDDFFFISSNANHGLSTAMKAGFDTAESPFIGYIDSDLQTHPEDFNKLLPFRNDYELVTGIRAKRKDTWAKRKQSKIANGFRRSMTGDKATDTGCPLKVINSTFARRMPFFNGMHRFLPALIMMMGGKMKELPVSHFPREAGVSKYHLWNRLKGPFLDCFAFRWMKTRYISYDIDDSNVEVEGAKTSERQDIAG